MDLTTEDFKEKIFDFENNTEWQFKGSKNTIIRMTATWCSPCKSYAPIYEKVATETPNIDFYTVDVDEEPEIAQFFGVRSIPTTIFLTQGKQPMAGSGVLSQDKLTTVIKDYFDGDTI